MIINCLSIFCSGSHTLLVEFMADEGERIKANKEKIRLRRVAIKAEKAKKNQNNGQGGEACYVPPKIVDKIVDEFGEPLEWKG